MSSNILPDIPYKLHLNAENLVCPMPLLKMKQVLKKMHKGDTLLVTATDSGTSKDFKKYVEYAGYKLISYTTKDKYYYWITIKHESK
ncbi:MAG: sulfurtransferase TusA family protein [Gammaproteobacteria bacterium]|nr:sulfurtransferase TusA family protein [Gammaproteobacteria bacterium]